MFEELSVGCRVELDPKNKKTANQEEKVSLGSQVVELKEDTIVCAMPIVEGKLIVLDIGTVYDAFFFTVKGMYRAKLSVVGRGKEGNIYTVELSPETKVERFQRREFFRLECLMPAYVRVITEENAEYFINNEKFMPDSKPLYDEKLVMLDLSGGGARLLAKTNIEKESYLVLNFIIEEEKGNTPIQALGKVVMSNSSHKRGDMFDIRVKFISIPKAIRERIVKYIFDEQRKMRKKERG